jgi:hypothetical protein
MFIWGVVVSFAHAQQTTAPTSAMEFRCESEVFVGLQKQPIQASLTLFSGRMVYDFQLNSPEEITIFDFHKGQITLLMPEQKRRLVVATDDLLRVCAAYKTMHAETELFQFCNQPKFEISSQGSTIELRGGCLNYRAECTTANMTDAEKAYREFTDWSARMNALSPGNLPPFARLELNRTIASEQRLPRRIERTISYMQGGVKKMDQTRSEHLFDWKLSATDRTRIEHAQQALAQYAPLELKDYLNEKGK